MNKKTKGIIYNILAFALFFFATRYLIASYTSLEDFTAKIIAFIVGTILAPKFQSVNTHEGEKLFMKWIFIKELKEIK